MEQEPDTGQAQEALPHGLPRWAKLLIGLGIAIPVLVVGCGLAATLVVPLVFQKLFMAQRAQAEADLAAILEAVQWHSDAKGRLPESLEELVRPDEEGYAFLKSGSVPVDPWGNEYGYERLAGGGARVFSLGADGAPGGEGDDADIENLSR